MGKKSDLESAGERMEMRRKGMKGKERKKAHRELVYIKPIRTKPNKRKKKHSRRVYGKDKLLQLISSSTPHHTVKFCVEYVGAWLIR